MSEEKKTPKPYQWTLPVIDQDKPCLFTLNEPIGRITREFSKLNDEAIRIGERSETTATEIMRIEEDIRIMPLSLAHQEGLGPSDDNWADKLDQPPAGKDALEKLLSKKYDLLDSLKAQAAELLDKRFVIALKPINKNKGQEDVTSDQLEISVIGSDIKHEVCSFFTMKWNGTLPKPNASA
jgi:hypothetical protein